MEIQGKVCSICDAQSGISQKTGNQWMSQEFVIDYFWWPNQTQPSQMMLRVFGEDRIKQFDLHVNDEVKINFHIEAELYKGRWYNKVNCDRLEKIGASAVNQTAGGANGQQVNNTSQQAIGGPQTPPFQPQAAPFPPQTDANGNPINKEGEKGDDLPF